MTDKSITIGLPRALGYYEYLPYWRVFFESLGCAVVLSPPTNKAILDQGVRSSVDEVCLPVKIYYGHVRALAGKVDYVFLPRLISVEEKTYLCPKFLGLPDMIRAAAIMDGDYPELLVANVNSRLPGGGWEQALTEVALAIGCSRSRIKEALRWGKKAQEEFENTLEAGEYPPDVLARWEKSGRLLESYAPREFTQKKLRAKDNKEPVIAVIGHPYQLFDPFTSMNLMGRLKEKGIKVITPMAVTNQRSQEATIHLPKRIFWSFGQKLLGGSLHFLQEKIDGLIYVAAFGCGPDSLVGELVERYAKRSGQVPTLYLTIDEHTGEAGIVTRIEAFLDLIERKKVEIETENDKDDNTVDVALGS
ncbi:acyl-CoA dehydratase activase-related protein [Heliorestis acidaminivorans]|uniref:acyl-CoA dehydratase activase-related protein n=1 Tax=Heliorestis acidaminivorans TaxID=553427 RepID=UPI0014797B03|nr:acyl-CoA dehydratase activase-related protein [Heliorestis acidaminivorans]